MSPPKQISQIPSLTPLQRNSLLQIDRRHFKNLKTLKNFKSNNNEKCNKDVTIKERRKALKECHDTAVGWDDNHYQFLNHLLFRSLDSLFRILIKSGILVFSQIPGRKL